MTSIGIYGSLGRMGQAIAAAAPEMNAQVAGGADVQDDPLAIAAAAVSQAAASRSTITTRAPEAAKARATA